MRDAAGFTLTDLIISLAAISIVAVVAIPLLLSARLSANETAAVAALRDIAAGEAQFQAARHVDVDRDGVGEFGYFKEMTGAVGVRTTADGGRAGDVLDPPALSRTFLRLNAQGEASSEGYLFKIFLPGAGGAGVGESARFPVERGVDAALATRIWGCYAWPSRHGTSGARTFFVGAAAVMVSVDSASYSRPEAIDGANCGAALDSAGRADVIVGEPAVGKTGRDGHVWRRQD